MDRKKGLLKKLTTKQRHFCSEYILDWNGARAARAVGYAEKTSREMAYELLTKPYIKEYIEIIKDDIEGELGISKAKSVKILSDMAYSDISDLYKDWMTLENFNTLKEERPELMACIQEISTKTEMEKSGGIETEPVEIRYIKIKLYDKRLALQDLNKMMGWNEAEKHVVTNVMDVSGLPTDELLKRAAAIDKINKE